MADGTNKRPAQISRRGFLKQTGGATVGLTLLATIGCGEDGADPRTNGSPRSEPPQLGPAQGLIADRRSAKVTFSGPDRIEVGQYATWTIHYTAGDEGLYPGALVAIVVEHGADWGDAKFFGRDKFAGVRIQTDSKAVLERFSALWTNGNTIIVKVVRGRVRPSEKISFTIGEPDSEGGVLRAPSIAHDATIRVFHNLHGEKLDDHFLQLDEISQGPVVTVEPGPTVRIEAIAKTVAQVGQPVDMVVRAEDRFGNIASDYVGSFSIFDDRNDRLLGNFRLGPEQQGWGYPQGIAVYQPGITRLRLKGDSVSYSDPIEIVDNPSHEAVRWGQIHGHSIVSDGLGSAPDYYDYARQQGNLDFCALTDHGYLTEPITHPAFLRHVIEQSRWGDYAKATQNAHDPGSFVTFLAYEWTSHIFSDKNVYFFDDRRPWQSYPRTQTKLYETYRGQKVMIVSHMMWGIPFMRATDWDNFDPTLERIVEICSVHGAREYAYNPYFPDDNWTAKMGLLMSGHLVADGLKKGHKLGIVCGADTHTGCPGSSIAGIQPCSIDGLMALRSATLSREAIWDRWYNRRTYGTSGPRILLDVSLNGYAMGSEVPKREARVRIFEVTVYGKRGISKIELVGADPQKPVDTITFNPPQWNPGTVELVDGRFRKKDTYYYIRVFQRDGHIAWSSPIWIV